MISAIIDDALVRQADRIIEDGRSLVVIAHEHPDGDAVGAALAAAHFLRAMGKTDVHVMLPDAVPDNLHFLPGVDDILFYDSQKEICEALLGQADVIVYLDMSELSRSGRNFSAFLRPLSARTILIDHHENPEPFAEVTISQPSMSSTCELLFRYVYQSGRLDKLGREAAVCLCTGLMTDTGFLSYNSNQPEVYLVLHRLLEMGADKDYIYRCVSYSNSENRTRMLGYALCHKLEVIEPYHTAIVCLTRQEMSRYDAQPGDTDNFVNQGLFIKGIRMSVLIKEDTPIRISFRSVGQVPVNELAARLFGGGGHVNAAGARFDGTWQEARQRILDALPEFRELVTFAAGNN